jgi:hypothetical protein
VTTASGAPRSGVKVVFTANSAPLGSVTTGSNGQALFDYVPVQSGSDTIVAFADLNSNGTREEAEPQRQAQVAVGGQVSAPIQGQTLNVAPLAGTVKVKFPKGFTPTGKQSAFAHSAQSKFTQLKSAQSIPVGSQLDVSRGRVQLASSQSGVATSSTIQTSSFSACAPTKKTCRAPSSTSAMFSMSQGRTGNGLTEMVMLGSLTCKSGSGKAVAAARKKSRSLWGNGKGRFRTRGRNSSATVRGTQWLTKDTCSGTETRVTRGTVIVKDFAKGKNITVKQGKRYIARPKKGKGK